LSQTHEICYGNSIAELSCSFLKLTHHPTLCSNCSITENLSAASFLLRAFVPILLT